MNIKMYHGVNPVAVAALVERFGQYQVTEYTNLRTDRVRLMEYRARTKATAQDRARMRVAA